MTAGASMVYRPVVPSDENVNSSISAFYFIGATSDAALVARTQLFAKVSALHAVLDSSRC